MPAVGVAEALGEVVFPPLQEAEVGIEPPVAVGRGGEWVGNKSTYYKSIPYSPSIRSRMIGRMASDHELVYGMLHSEYARSQPAADTATC